MAYHIPHIINWCTECKTHYAVKDGLCLRCYYLEIGWSATDD